MSGIAGLLAGRIRERFLKAQVAEEELYEIRLRAGRPVTLIYRGEEVFLSKEGGLTGDVRLAFAASTEDVRETLEYAAGYSLYAFEEEIRQGFLTVAGGHRVGVAGRVRMEGDRVASLQDISSINLRLAHEKKGCANGVLPLVRRGNSLYHTLIISPPRCGKTTLLRDLVRQLSDGDGEHPGLTVGVVDERSEIGGAFRGVPQNDLGSRTDLLDACPKREGMMMLVRSMAPQVVAVDELGPYEDIQAIQTVIYCGCRLLATMHGHSLKEVMKKPLMERLLKEQVFGRYLVLSSGSRAGILEGVYDKEGKKIAGGGGCWDG